MQSWRLGSDVKHIWFIQKMKTSFPSCFYFGNVPRIAGTGDIKDAPKMNGVDIWEILVGMYNVYMLNQRWLFWLAPHVEKQPQKTSSWRILSSKRQAQWQAPHGDTVFSEASQPWHLVVWLIWVMIFQTHYRPHSKWLCLARLGIWRQSILSKIGQWTFNSFRKVMVKSYILPLMSLWYCRFQLCWSSLFNAWVLFALLDDWTVAGGKRWVLRCFFGCICMEPLLLLLLAQAAETFYPEIFSQTADLTPDSKVR